MPAKVARDVAYLFDRSIPEPNTGCWLWLGALNKDGYAIISGRPWCGHRLALELKIGDIPKGMETDHICRVRSCVNPDHVQALTHLDNVRRAVRGPNHNSLKTHCPKGHPLFGDNMFLKRTPRGVSRQCRECSRERYRQQIRGQHG